MTEDQFPPLLDPADQPPVTSPADLSLLWRRLMGRLGFGCLTVWAIFFDEAGRSLPVVVPVEEMPPLPTPTDGDRLVEFCQAVLADSAPEGSFAILVSRPGARGLSRSDRAWGTEITLAARRVEARMWQVHLANDHELGAFADDELTRAG